MKDRKYFENFAVTARKVLLGTVLSTGLLAMPADKGL